ncbi:MAG TPA: heme-binding domain-containing protein [Vicinamibacterales bacterium]
MRRTRAGAMSLGALLLAAQFWQPERTNPPVDPAASLDQHVTVPADVAAILERSCRDCHTNETRWPPYAYLSPFSWAVASHVQQGRDHLNFSEWGLEDPESMQDLLEEICEEVRDGTMPLPSYTIVHRSARLAPAEVTRLCSWTDETIAALDGRRTRADSE